MKILFLSFLPVLFLGIYIHYTSKEKSALSNLILGSFVAFMIIMFISILGALVFPNLFKLLDDYSTIKNLLNIFLGLALIEEGIRWFVLYLIIYNVDKCDNSFDGVLYSVFISICTSFIENIFYVIGGGLTYELYIYYTAFSLHAFLGIVMGYFLVNAKNSKKNRVLNIICSLVIPIILYCLYFYSIYSGLKLLRIIYLGCIIFIIIYIYWKKM